MRLMKSVDLLLRCKAGKSVHRNKNDCLYTTAILMLGANQSQLRLQLEQLPIFSAFPINANLYRNKIYINQP